MADAIRYQIFEAVLTALGTIKIANGYSTDVAYVSEQLIERNPEEIDKRKFPALFPVDGNEKREQFAIGSGANSRVGTLSLLITCMVHDAKGVTAQKRNNLMRDVEKAIVNDSGINALIYEPSRPGAIQTDLGRYSYYSIWNQFFTLKYLYDSTLGG